MKLRSPKGLLSCSAIALVGMLHAGGTAAQAPDAPTQAPTTDSDTEGDAPGSEPAAAAAPAPPPTDAPNAGTPKPSAEAPATASPAPATEAPAAAPAAGAAAAVESAPRKPATPNAEAGASASGNVEIEGVGFASPDAAAVPPEGETDYVPPADEEEIIVTGSRVKRSGFAASAPVQIIDRNQLENSGASNLADVVQYLTVSQGSGYRGNAPGFGPGTVGVNLRGLGGSTTLTLINGRRPVTSAGGITTQYVDLASIPLAVVERVEILTGGASAIYGSDAIAGVVNIITRHDWDGVRVEVEGETTDNTDHDSETASVAFGSTSERARVNVALQYTRTTELTADERSQFTRGPEKDQGYSTTGQPAAYVTATGLSPDPACTYDEMTGIENVPGSRPLPSATGFGDVCRFDYLEFSSLIGAGERINAFGSAEYDITKHTTLFAEVNVGRLRGDGVTSPSFPLVPEIGVFPLVPADHVDNPFGSNLTLIGRPLGRANAGNRNLADDDTYRTVAGIKGDFEDVGASTLFEDWEWELFGTWGVSRYRLLVHDILREPFEDALNSCSDPTDLSGCFNPFYSAVDGTGTPNTTEVIDTFSSAMESLADQSMHSANVGISGSLFELPGGNLAYALGGQYRREARSTELDHDANELRYAFIIGNPDAVAARDVWAAYAELVAPVYNGIETQLAGRFETYTDTDDNSFNPTIGLVLSPAEIVGRDRVADELHRLQLRGHLAFSSRAPSLFQSYPGFAVLPTSIDTGGIPLFIPVQASGNPDVQTETAVALSAGFLWSPIDELSLIADVWHYDYKNRIATNDAQGVFGDAAYRMDNMLPLSPDVDYDADGNVTRIRTSNRNFERVITNGLDFTAIIRLTGETFGGSENDWGTITLTTTGTYTHSFEIPAVDAARTLILNGQLDDCDGAGEALKQLQDDDRLGDNEAVEEALSGKRCEVSGLTNRGPFAPAVPKLRANFPLTWEYDGHAVSFITHFISGLDDDESLEEPDAMGNRMVVTVADSTPDSTFVELHAWLSFDLQYGYTLHDEVGKELTLRVGVENLFEEEPPGVSIMNGFITTHDPRGRMFYAKLTQVF